jgi:hypothetical protein
MPSEDFLTQLEFYTAVLACFLIGVAAGFLIWG